jgi:hypothetical protein
MSQDGYTFWAFTSFVGAVGVPATHYYKIVEGVVVADGPVDPPRDLRAFGVQCAVASINGVMSAENDGVHFWYISTLQNDVHIFEIDDLGNFAEWGGGSLTIPWTPEDINNRATMKALAQEGYAGAFFGDAMVLLSRFVPGIAGIPLSEIAGDLRHAPARRAYDVTALVPIVDGAIIDSPQSACRDNVNPFQSAYQFDGVSAPAMTLSCAKACRCSRSRTIYWPRSLAAGRGRRWSPSSARRNSTCRRRYQSATSTPRTSTRYRRSTRVASSRTRNHLYPRRFRSS